MAEVMTQGAFAKGWKLLIVQPWGKAYRELDGRGQPTVEAATQLSFYYDKLKWAAPGAWYEVAQLYAQGSSWPSVNDLKQALQAVNGKYVRSLPAPTAHYEPMPDAVRKKLAKIGVVL